QHEAVGDVPLDTHVVRLGAEYRGVVAVADGDNEAERLLAQAGHRRGQERLVGIRDAGPEGEMDDGRVFEEGEPRWQGLVTDSRRDRPKRERRLGRSARGAQRRGADIEAPVPPQPGEAVEV